MVWEKKIAIKVYQTVPLNIKIKINNPNKYEEIFIGTEDENKLDQKIIAAGLESKTNKPIRKALKFEMLVCLVLVFRLSFSELLNIFMLK